ncbi:PEP-CTERM sorting domain-containing protein [Massilia sp. W12]|uniref:PEP-CTERM sorting domain-containing protein n=1 Tax=Massilia sp. W12 TaxID=3126507 RepID=UPI0030D38DD6
MKMRFLCFALLACVTQAQAATVLYSQNFEAPTGYIPSTYYHDLSSAPVNSLYGNQPAGFTFNHTYTVETLHISGGRAFGNGYQDPQHKGGNYALGMLESVQDDRLGLNFNVAGHKFLNFRLDVSRIGLSGGNGPFANDAPKFRFSLFDNPLGQATINGNGVLLSSLTMEGANSAHNGVFNWTNLVAALDASRASNGNVTLQIDLIRGGYAAMDNFVIAASDNSGEVPQIPEAETWAMLLAGLGGLGLLARRRQALIA